MLELYFLFLAIPNQSLGIEYVINNGLFDAACIKINTGKTDITYMTFDKIRREAILLLTHSGHSSGNDNGETITTQEF